MKPIIKLVIAILLLLCLADMPYGFYQLVRFAAMAAFLLLPWLVVNKIKNAMLTYVYIP